MGHSTGLVFAHFPDKESVWRAAMGTSPPVDSPLTRAAPDLLAALLVLLARHRGTSPAADDLWDSAERAVQSALGAPPSTRDALSRADERPTLDVFAAEMLAEARLRDALPSFKGIMEPVFGLCEMLVAQAQQKASPKDIYAAAVAAGATIAQVAVHGAQDVPGLAIAEDTRTGSSGETDRPRLVRQGR